MKLKLCFFVAVGFLLSVFLFGCTNQTPVSQAPVYNITYTDNSQTISGDNNNPVSKPDTSTDQVAKPDIATKADNTTSNMWIYWLIITVVAGIAGYFVWKKWIKK